MPHGKKKNKKIKKLHVAVTYRQNVEIFCLGVTYLKESSVCKGGILKKKFTGGVSQNRPTLQGVSNIFYLTLFFFLLFI
jgi:hypothetical protein